MRVKFSIDSNNDINIIEEDQETQIKMTIDGDTITLTVSAKDIQSADGGPNPFIDPDMLDMINGDSA